MGHGVAVYMLRGNHRSQVIGRALAEGVRRAGDAPVVRGDGEYRRPRERVAAFYGYQKNHPRIMEEFRAAGRDVVFVDLGYWGRHEGGRWNGYHKVAVNDRHPTAYFMAQPRRGERFKRFKIRLLPWRRVPRHILLAGMSAKSAESYGYGPEEWERWAVREIRRQTDRRIIYRPKPSWSGATHIDGTLMSPKWEPLEGLLNKCHAVVTHHSNVAIDGLVAGVPAFCWDGVAVPMSSQDMSQIETPWCPDGREQWLNNIAWCQWNIEEMRNGTMWRHLKGEGLIP